MAAMELNLAGGRMVNRVARSWKMRLCVLQSHSLPPRFPVPPAPLRAHSVFPPSSLHVSLSLTLPILGKYVSIYMRARDRVIPCDRIVPMCARSISI